MSERIISLTSENIKRLKAIHITPNGRSVEVAGPNGAGKSSVLDSIWYALAGRSVLPDRPIRDGQSRAEVTVELDSYTITRSFTAAGGGVLKVVPKGEKTAPVASPQTFLDGLLSSLTFDPFTFTLLKESQQGECLRKLIGLDFASMENQGLQFYNRRTEVNRTVSQLTTKLSGLAPQPVTSDAPAVMSEILAARGAAVAQNESNNQKRKALLDGQQQLRNFTREEGELREEIIGWELRVANAKNRLDEKHKLHQEYAASVAPLLDEVGKLQDRDLSEFDSQILAAESHNERLKSNAVLADLTKQYAAACAESLDLTIRIDLIAKQKVEALAAAKFPLVGLGFSATGGVTFNGVPFAQISTAEQIRISAAIGLALNPGLRVMFIRNGSLIDDAGMKILVALAESHDAQLWIERVGALSGELPGVVIEDGAVAQYAGLA